MTIEQYQRRVKELISTFQGRLVAVMQEATTAGVDEELVIAVTAIELKKLEEG